MWHGAADHEFMASRGRTPTSEHARDPPKPIADESRAFDFAVWGQADSALDKTVLELHFVYIEASRADAFEGRRPAGERHTA